MKTTILNQRLPFVCNAYCWYQIDKQTIFQSMPLKFISLPANYFYLEIETSLNVYRPPYWSIYQKLKELNVCYCSFNQVKNLFYFFYKSFSTIKFHLKTCYFIFFVFFKMCFQKHSFNIKILRCFWC